MTSLCPPAYFVVECVDDVGAERDRLLQVARRERVVDDEERALGVRDLGDAGDVGDAEQRVGRRLDPDQLGDARPDRRAHVVDLVDRGDGVVDAARSGDPVEVAGRCRRRRRWARRRGRRGRAARGRRCPARRGRWRTRSRAHHPRARRSTPRARSGSGWRSASTRTRRAARRRRPACRSTSGRSAPRPSPWPGRPPGRRGWPGWRSRSDGVKRSPAESSAAAGSARRGTVSGPSSARGERAPCACDTGWVIFGFGRKSTMVSREDALSGRATRPF